jgi:serine/threonine protein kinase
MTGIPFDAGARFVINGKLGSGSFGIVYDAVDRYRNRPVALKVLERAAPETVMRFKREFRYLAAASPEPGEHVRDARPR